MMRLSRTLLAALVAMAVAVAAPAGAQQGGEARLGGGSDVPSGTTVRVPQAGRLPPIHYIFVDNPEGEPLRVEFRADAPRGISVTSEWAETTVPAGGRVENRFGITVGPGVAAGDYPVVVQLVRSDIEAQPGRVTNIPAVQTSFTLEVTGAAATVAVRSVSAFTGEPVTGTLTLSAVLPDGGHFEMDRVEGSSLEALVAPGEYRAALLLGERIVASQDLVVAADERHEVLLEVETVSFVLAAVRPVEERGRLVVVDLAAAVNNEAEPIPGPVSLRVVVLHQGVAVDTVTLLEDAELPVGLTESTVTYRPADGWQPGSYRFRFELAAPGFVLTAAEVPTLDIPPRSGFDLQGWLDTLGQREIIALAAAAVLALLVVERIARFVVSRRRRQKSAPLRRGRRTEQARMRRAAKGQEKPTERRRRKHRGAESEGSWLEERIGPVSTPAIRWGNPHPTSPDPTDYSAQPSPDEPTLPISDTTPPTERLDLAGPPKPEDEEEGTVIGTAIARSDPPHHPTFPKPPASQPADTRDPAHIAGSLRLMQRLHDQGILAPEWSIADATIIYWAMTSPTVRDALGSVGMVEDEYTAAITRLFKQGLLGRTAHGD